MSIDLLREIEYPESDGKPMAETPLHMRVMWDSIQTLNHWYEDDPNVYVWGNMFLYYVKGDPSKSVSPDVMAVFGVDKTKYRDVFKTWEEKRKPSAVIEVTSRKTKREDQKDKFILYRDVLKVKEYFLFDPRAEYIKPALRGYRLRAGEYVPIEEIDGRLPSQIFNLHLQRNGKELRFWNPVTEQWLPTPEEHRQIVEEKLTESETERKFEQYRREIAEKDAELLQHKHALAQAEIERLSREVESLKQQRANES